MLNGTHQTRYAQRSAADELARATDALWSIPCPADRDSWWPIIGSALAEGIPEDVLLRWCEAGPAFDRKDAVSTIRSMAKRAGNGRGSLFAAARAAGWRDDATDRTETPTRPAKRAEEAPKPSGKGERRAFDFRAVWDASEPADESHGYITRKAGFPFGLRVYRGPLTVAGQPLDGALLVPAFDAAGELQSWQAIPAEPRARKLNAPAATMAGARFIVGGPVRDGEPVHLAEGIGAAWSIHQATGKPAACCFGAGNIERVARDIRARHPAARIVIVADRAKEAEAERIARDIGGAWVGLPEAWPANSDANDVHTRDGLEALAQLLATAKEPARRFRLLTADDLAALPPVRWRVRGVLPAEGLASVFGPSGSGKSFLALDLLGAVADGREWFGHRTDPAPVVYVALEGEGGIAQRVAAYRSKHGRAPGRMRFIAQPLALLEPGDVAELADDIRAAGGAGGIVAIDTLNRASPGADENDSRDMGAVIAGAKALQAALGGLVLLVHHSGKDAARGMRGHSSLHAALDAVIEVTRDGIERREWKVAKSKDGEDGEAFPFRLGVVELGTNEHGEPVTSCTVEREEHAADAVRRVKLPQGGNQRIVWDTLGEALRDSRDHGQAGAPPGRPCIRLDAAVERCRGRLTCASDRQAERARDAVTGLVARGAVVLRDGWLWLP